MAVCPSWYTLYLPIHLGFCCEASAGQSVTGSSSDSVCKGAWWPVTNYTFDELVVKTMPHVSSPGCKLPGYWRVSCINYAYFGLESSLFVYHKVCDYELLMLIGSEAKLLMVPTCSKVILETKKKKKITMLPLLQHIWHFFQEKNFRF